MSESRREFETQAPRYIMGRLWLRLLRSRRNPQPGQSNLEAWIKAYCKDCLEIEKTFPTMVQTYALMPLPRLCQLATEHLSQQCSRLNVSWSKELQIYVQRWQTYNQNIGQELANLQSFLDRLFTLKVNNKTIAEWLTAYDDDPLLSAKPFNEHPAFQGLLTHDNSEVFNLIQDYWRTTKRLEAFLTDMVLVNDWLGKVTIKDSQKFLLEDTHRAYYLSSAGLLFLLSGQQTNVPALWRAPMTGCLIAPCELLKHLEAEEWDNIIEYEIGLNSGDLETWLANPSPAFLATFPFSVAFAHVRTPPRFAEPSFATALLSIFSWLEQLTDKNFVNLIMWMDSETITAFLSNQESSHAMIMRFINLLNDDSHRIEFFKHYAQENHRLQRIECWLTDLRLLSALNLAAFEACFVVLEKKGFEELFQKQPEFLKRILNYSKEILIALIEKNTDKSRSVDVCLTQPAIVEKLDSDDDLIKIIDFSLRCSFEKIGQINPVLDKRLTGEFLLKLMRNDRGYEYTIIESESLMSRFSIQNMVSYLEENSVGPVVKRFEKNIDIIPLLSTKRLTTLLEDEENAEVKQHVKAELQRRKELEEKAKASGATAISSFVQNGENSTSGGHLGGNHFAQKTTPAVFIPPLRPATHHQPSSTPQSPPTAPTHTATNAVLNTPNPNQPKSVVTDTKEECNHLSLFWLFFERISKTMFVILTAALAVSALISMPLPVMIGLAIGASVALMGCLICFSHYAISKGNCFPHTNAWTAFFFPSDDCYDEKHYSKQVDNDDASACALC